MEREKYVKCYYGYKKEKIVEIHIGKIYIVDPLNPAKKKYRGEKVRLVKHESFGGETFVLRIESEWHVKRNEYTKIDICDLQLDENQP